MLVIPPEWRTTVARILRSGDPQRIDTKVQSDLDWGARFPEEDWDYVRFGAMATALDAPDIQGRHITTMKEPGETYAFWFFHRNVQMYGKINLKPDGKVIVIYSSHFPRKGMETL